MIAVQGLWKSFGGRDLFKDADLHIGPQERIALIGPNGSGKTTFFDILAGVQKADGGQVRRARDLTIGYLRQETDELRGRSVLDEAVSARGEVAQIAGEMASLSQAIAVSGRAERAGLLERYGALQERFETLGGYQVKHEAKQILGGLGFGTEDLSRRTDTFSGGWLMRIALGKLLLRGPGLLLLDEPTNHLDLASVEWLERFLTDYQGTVMFTSHDRDFINAFARRTVEIADGELVSYAGNFDDYEQQRDLTRQQAEAAAKNQQRWMAQQQRFVDRFRGHASKARQVQSRIKMMERAEKMEVPTDSTRTMGLRFPAAPRPGRVALELKSFSFAYGDRPVYRDGEFTVERGEKIALVGPNGAGKTTLLKLSAGVLKPQRGERRLGHAVSVGYFAQHQIEALDPSNSVLGELEGAVPSGVSIDARKLLGRFLFPGDDAGKPVSVLSGGEKTRLAMAKLLVQRHNLLCLDEPTNHLDMPSRDVLEQALVEFEGCLVLITHDRHLIRRVANRIVEVSAGELRRYHGDYEWYLSRRDAASQGSGAEPRPATRGAPAPDRKTVDKSRQERRRQRRLRTDLRRIESEIDEVAVQMRSIEAQLGSAGNAPEDVDQMARAYEQARARTEELEAEWDRLSSRVYE